HHAGQAAGLKCRCYRQVEAANHSRISGAEPVALSLRAGTSPTRTVALPVPRGPDLPTKVGAFSLAGACRAAARHFGVAIWLVMSTIGCVVATFSSLTLGAPPIARLGSPSFSAFISTMRMVWSS